MSRDVSTFRLALGPTLHLVQKDQQKTSVRAGLSIPLYANTNLLGDDKGVFKGVVRITPSFVALWDRQLDKRSYSFLLTVELFTARSMFSTDLTSDF